MNLKEEINNNLFGEADDLIEELSYVQQINESNFKIRCLKNDCDNVLIWFYKDEILECKNGIITWGGKKKEKGNNIYKSYDDFIEYWEDCYKGYFELIEVDGLSPKEYYELKAKEELRELSNYTNNTNSVNLNMSRINELTKLDNKSLLERTLKLSEECGEVAEATLSYLKTNGSQYKGKQLEDVLEENLDVIMVAISNICQLYNYEPNNKFIQDLFDTKLQKWYNKCCKDNDK